MQTKKKLLMILVVGLSHCLTHADGLTNNSTNRIKKIGDYSMMRGTNGYYIFVNPSEFWNGIWKEDTNGWRVQLRVYPETNLKFVQGHVYPVSTNLLLRVEWGSAIKNSWGSIEKPSGEQYYRTPNGKFAQFELRDAKGNVISPNPNAGTNLLEWLIYSDSMRAGRKLTYETNLPAWVSPASGSLVANFPKTISTNVYPQFQYGGVAGEIGANTNLPPFNVGLLKLDEIYSVTNEGDYTLAVEPVLYKKRVETNILDRVDLPCITTQIHLFPNVK